MIAEKQNQLQFYKLLKAQRITYSRAKSVRFTKYGITLSLVLIAPFIFTYRPEWNSIIGATGAVWTLLSFLIGYFERWLINRASRIQEIYDTELYELKWNEISYGKKVVPYEYVNNITRKYSAEELELEFKGWYEGINGIEKPLSVLLCQRQNIVWDYKLRDVFAYIVVSLLVLNFIVGLAIFAYSGDTLVNYLLGLALPSLSANILGIQEAIEHLQISKRKKNLEIKITEIVERMKVDLNDLSHDEMREIQNVIFDERSKAPLIPDLLYNMLKKKYSDNSVASIQDMLESLN
jgi:hypothetical protein